MATLVRETPLRYGQLVQAIEASEGVSRATAERLLKRAKAAGLVALTGGDYLATLTHPHVATEGERNSGE
ncbi:MAG: hypothetical protein ACE5H5_03120 [Nitrospinota bacterium]